MQVSPKPSPHIVLTVHGIRTFGQWQTRLGNLLSQTDSNIISKHYKFNYFSALAFMIPFMRWMTTRRFMCQLKELKKWHSDARIDIVAHSFGTHLVGWGLRRLPEAERPKIHTIILAGSVLKPGFPWNDLLDKGVVYRVINECGINDWVLVLNQLVVLFTGMAGRIGFAGMTGDQFMNRYYSFGHSDYFLKQRKPDDGFMAQNWIPLLAGTAIPASIDERTSKRSERILIFLLQNSEPIKLIAYLMIPVAFAVTYYNLYATASSREWAIKAISNLSRSPEKSIEMALRAIHVRETEEAEEALRQSLFESHLRLKLGSHENSVRSAEFSRDGELVLTASDDGKARIWNVKAGKLKFTLEHKGKINRAKFNSDFTMVVTASDDNTAQAWDAGTGQRLGPPLVHSGPVCMAEFSSDGQFILTASDDNTAQLWDARTGRNVLCEPFRHDEKVSVARFSPNNNMAVTVSGLKVQLRDLKTGELKSELIHDMTARDASFSPDGKLLVTACDNGRAYLWDIDHAEHPLMELKEHREPVLSAEFSPDGKKIVTASDDSTARIWEVSTGRMLAQLHGHTGAVKGAKFSPNSQWVLTRSYDNEAHVYEAQTGRILAELRGHTDAIRYAVFSQDNKFIVTASNDKTACIWQLSTENNCAELPHNSQVLDANFSSNGAFAITACFDSTAQVWQVDPTGAAHKFGNPIAHNMAVAAAAVSPKGNIALTVTGNNIGQLWKIDADGEWHETGDRMRHIVPRLDSSLDSEGNFSAVSSEGNAEVERRIIQVWKVSEAGWRKFAEAFTTEGGVISSPYLSGDGLKIVIYKMDNTARIWAADKSGAWREEGPVLKHSDGISTAAFSKDGKQLVTSSYDRTAHVWEVKTGQSIAELRGHSAWLISAAFSPDGRFVVTSSLDKTAQIWEIKTGKVMARLINHTNNVNNAVFDPTGKFVLTAGKDQTARIYTSEICGPLDDIQRLAFKRTF